MTRRPRRAIGPAGAVALLAVLAAAGCGNSPDRRAGAPRTTSTAPEAVLTPAAVDPAARRRALRSPRARGGRVVDVQGVSEGGAPAKTGVSPGAPTDVQVRADLREERSQLADFRRYLGGSSALRTGPRARVLPDGSAVAPAGAPEAVKRVIAAGNAIAKFPYKWGGGHGTWKDSGYDCSGSVSFALAGAGLLRAPLTSGGFMRWGRPGRGRWITIYANEGHMFMVVAGLRFDTSGRGRAGTRWQAAARSTAGLVARRIPGL